MKSLLRDSKVFRTFYYFLSAHVLGILIFLSVSQLTDNFQFVGLVGFLLAIGSYIILLILVDSVKAEIKAKYPQADPGKRKLLNYLFYFSQSVYLWVGIYILVSSLMAFNNAENKLVEIQGEIEHIEIVGKKDTHLKIKLLGNSNSYGIATFLIPDENLERIEKGLIPGMVVVIAIDSADETKVDDGYIYIFGIRTATFSYLTPQEYRKSQSNNELIGISLGTIFTFIGLAVFIYGRWELKKIRLQSNETVLLEH